MRAPPHAPRGRHPLVEATLLLGGMAILLCLSGWAVAGLQGALWTLIAGAITFVASGMAGPQVLLRMYRAQPLSAEEAPELIADVREICRRAGMRRAPRVACIPSPLPVGFTTGSGEETTIMVSRGMLRLMEEREMVGILAHEVGHIWNRDLWLMRLAGAIGQVTAIVSQIGILVMLINGILHLLNLPRMAWLHVVVLMAAPVAADLLLLALSRSREFEADRAAVELTRDPAGLVSALAKLDRSEAGLWRRFLPRRGASPIPTLLRTHPHTQERIRRLLAAKAG